MEVHPKGTAWAPASYLGHFHPENGAGAKRIQWANPSIDATPPDLWKPNSQLRCLGLGNAWTLMRAACGWNSQERALRSRALRRPSNLTPDFVSAGGCLCPPSICPWGQWVLTGGGTPEEMPGELPASVFVFLSGCWPHKILPTEDFSFLEISLLYEDIFWYCALHF